MRPDGADLTNSAARAIPNTGASRRLAPSHAAPRDRRTNIPSMARIDAPDAGLGPHIDWMMHRVHMATGVGALSEAVYGNTQLTFREREAARWIVAQLNACRVCQAAETADGEAHRTDEAFYTAVLDWRESAELTERERLAAEFAERFVRDHQAMDDEFWARLRTGFADDEIADLVICCGTFLGLGRMLAVLDVDPPDAGLTV